MAFIACLFPSYRDLSLKPTKISHISWNVTIDWWLITKTKPATHELNRRWKVGRWDGEKGKVKTW